MFSTSFLEKITGPFSRGVLLSGALPALLVFGYTALIISRVTDWPVAQVLENHLTLAPILTTLGLIALTLLLHSLNPLFQRWLCGDIPLISKVLLERREQQRRNLEEKLTKANELFEQWEEKEKGWVGELDVARAAYVQAESARPTQEELKAVQTDADNLQIRIEHFIPPQDGDTDKAIRSLLDRLITFYKQTQVPVETFDKAYDALRARLGIIRTQLLEVVKKWQRTLTIQFPGGDVVQPTQFGNVMAAIDSYAFTRYGMDGVVLWSRLRSAVKATDAWSGVDEAKPVLEFLVAATCIHFVLAIFTLATARLLWAWDPLLIVFLLAGSVTFSWIFYKAATQALSAFGLEVCAMFDLHRWTLLDTLHLSRPQNAEEEFALWSRVTAFVIEVPSGAERRRMWYR